MSDQSVTHFYLGTCPPSEELQAIYLGLVPALDAEQIEAHIVHCPDCQERMDEVCRLGANAEDLLESEGEDSSLPKLPHYEMIERIGRGGMGVVYKARDERLDRTVAIKMILFGLQPDDQTMARFETEAHAVARLSHPNILAVHELGRHHGIPYLVLEYIDGANLAETLRQRKVLPWKEASELTRTLAKAIHEAHEEGVIHRDLKPGNVLMTRDNVPKVCDFGLAKLVDTDAPLTRTADVFGTPSYMAPEQIRSSRKVGPAADVYALGAMLYEMLVGRPPFQGATPLEIFDQVTKLDPVSPKQLVPEVPRDLETICLQCLEKDPKRRYDSAEELADDLTRFLNHEPIKARPISFFGKAAKWTKRRPATAALVGVSVLAFLILSIGGWAGNGFLSAALAETKKANEKAEREKTVALQAQAKAEKADDEKRIQLAKTETALGDNARQRGFYKKAIDHWEKAIGYWKQDSDKAHQQEVPLRLKQIRAHGSLSLLPEAKKLLAKITKHPNIKDHQAEVLLIRAEVALDTTPEQSEKLFRQAIEAGLSKADEGFARGCVAESTVEAIRHFRTALEHDKSHYTARVYLGLDLLFLGRVEEAQKVALTSKAIFPKDRNFQILIAMTYALQRKAKELEQEMQTLRPGLPKNQRAVVDQAIELMFMLANLDHTAPDKLMPKFAQMAKGQKFGAIFGLMNQAAARPGQNAPKMLRLPPSIGKIMNRIVGNAKLMVFGTVPPKAVAEFEKAVEQHPEASLCYAFGKVLEMAGQTQRAEAAYLKACELRSVANIKKMALLDAIRLEIDELLLHNTLEAKLRAETNLRKLLKLGPLSRDQARNMIEKAMLLGPEWIDHLVSRLDAKLQKDLSIMEAKMTGFLGTHRWSSALQVADTILKKYPTHNKATRARAKALEEIKLLAAVAPYLDPTPEAAEDFAKLGAAYVEQNAYPEAYRPLRKAIALKTKDAEAYDSLARIYVKYNNQKDAIRAWKRAIELAPKNPLYYDHLSRMYRLDGKVEAAFEVSRKAYHLAPKDMRFNINLGMVHAMRGEHEKAIELCEKAVALAPENGSVYGMLGVVLVNIGEFEKALQLFQKSVAMLPRTNRLQGQYSQMIGMCKRWQAQDKRLREILDKKAKPKDNNELLSLAEFCQRHKRYYASSTEFYAKAFVKLNKVSKSQYESAANAAIWAAAGKAKDTPHLTAKQREQFHQQAHTWLRKELKSWRDFLKSSNQMAVGVEREMARRQEDIRFASVRENEALAKLSKQERALWTQYWVDVAALHKAAKATYKETDYSDTLTVANREKTYNIAMKAGNFYYIRVKSYEFLSHVSIADATGNILQRNHSARFFRNRTSSIRFTPKQDGIYRITASCFLHHKVGNYELSIREYVK